jgi:hypothetical protein
LPTEEELCAALASGLHSLPFDRDKWLGLFEGFYNRMLEHSLARTGLPDHPAYVAVHQTFGAYLGLRYREFATPPSALSLLSRAARAPQETQALGRALAAMDLVDSGFANLIRLGVKADLDGGTARKLAEKSKRS